MRPPYASATTYLVALSAFLLDQLTKLAIVTALALGHSRPLVDGLLALTHVRNYGASFSLLWGHAGLLAVVAIAITTALVAYERRARLRGPLLVAGLGLVLGGALGNLADRVVLGYVRDMIDVQWHGANVFPVFNVADSAVFVGTLLLLWHHRRQEAVPA